MLGRVLFLNFIMLMLFTTSAGAEHIHSLSPASFLPNGDLLVKILLILVFLLLIGLICFLLSYTEKSSQKLQKQMITDNETGIGNLAFFDEKFQELTAEENVNHYIAYIVIDSSYLQVYHGEVVFDDAVKYVASVLSDTIENQDFVARITENGFALVYSADEKEKAKERFFEMINKLEYYIEKDRQFYQPYFRAVMYSLNPGDVNSEFLLFNLRKRCNALLGTDRCSAICEEDLLEKAIDERKLIEDIASALEKKEFKLYLQFLVDNQSKKLVSCEALSRWHSAERGLLMPGTYIGVMEKSGLISELDYYMFDKVCRQLHKWKDTEFDFLSISCNFTRITLSADDFMERITEVCKRYIFDRSKLIIEITEEAMERNRAAAISNILACKKLGFGIALDDLGAGYTSLINLCEYPIDIVKLDREILLKTDKKSGVDLFKGIVSLAHSLGLSVICEGVETEAQNQMVSRTDCDYIQGWYYSLVYPAPEGEAFARAYLQKNKMTR